MDHYALAQRVNQAFYTTEKSKVSYDSGYSEKKTKIVGATLVGIAVGVGSVIAIPTLIGNHLASQQMTRRVEACSHLGGKVAVECVQTTLYGPQYNTTYVAPKG